MKRKILIPILVTLVALFLIPSKTVYADEQIYGHISFVDHGATVVREDQTENKAVVNLPIVPGDQIITGDNERCEIQFDNGTVIRLDKNTKLEVTTVLAPSLTSRWDITTLNLLQGQLYTISQTYNKEMFQIITPNTAFNLKSSSKSIIRVKGNGETYAESESGKFEIMYGNNQDQLKTQKVKSGQAFIITRDNRIEIANFEPKDIDFMAWNEYITNNFKKLHSGISNVPPKLERYKNNALTYWVENWSSLYGQWVYNDLFGYVWRPYDEIFALSQRPFFHADFIQINGQTFVVPQQPWGWVPAHLGTWVWLNRGWTWIPGDVFQPGAVMHRGNYYFPTLEYYMSALYGDFDLYMDYRLHGYKYWRNAYRTAYHLDKKEPKISQLPTPLRKIFNRINKTSPAVLKDHLAINNRSFIVPIDKTKIDRSRSIGRIGTGRQPGGIVQPNTPNPTNPSVRVNPRTTIIPGTRVTPNTNPKAPSASALNRITQRENFRDFNPDKQWAKRNGVSIRYSSQKNEIIAPSLGISSQQITRGDRMLLRNSSPSMLQRSSAPQGSQLNRIMRLRNQQNNQPIPKNNDDKGKK